MPSDVNLNVSDTVKTGTGWIEVTASNGVSYWYKWNGGNGAAGNGHNQFNIGAAQSFDITFTGTDGTTYKFTTFFNKNNCPDLSGTIDANGDTVTVTDQCSNVGDFHYGVEVALRSDTSVTFNCDPVISNKQTQLV